MLKSNERFIFRQSQRTNFTSNRLVACAPNAEKTLAFGQAISGNGKMRVRLAPALVAQRCDFLEKKSETKHTAHKNRRGWTEHEFQIYPARLCSKPNARPPQQQTPPPPH